MYTVAFYRKNGKLVFTCCYQCALEENSHIVCDHSAKQRSLHSTWFIEGEHFFNNNTNNNSISMNIFKEIKLALNHGYKLMEVCEILHFELKSKDIFKKHIDAFLKLKFKAKGLDPAWSDRKTDGYISALNDYFGWDLQRRDFERNDAMYFISKIFCNSFCESNNVF